MAFDEVQFPVDISFGSAGGPGYNTQFVETDGGREERIQRWPDAKRNWDVRYGINTLEKHAALQSFFLARDGGVRGFRFRDLFDFVSSPTFPFRPTAKAITDQEIGTGDGTTTQFQLIKKYTSGSQTKTRQITKPVAGSVVIAVNAVAQTEGVDFTVNTATGIVTFMTAPTNTHSITAGFEFDTPARFGEEADRLLRTTYENFESGTAAIPVVELLEDTAVEGDFNPGGHQDVSLTADITITVIEARNWSIDAASAGLDVILQDPTSLPPGAVYFAIHNVGPTHAFNLQDDGLSTLLSVAAGTSVSVGLYVEADGTTKGWVAW